MPFEVRAVEHEKESEAPVIGRFADAEWWNLTALAHECGFDAGREHERAVYPEESDTHELDFRLKGAALERLMEHLARGPIRITRVAPES